jgi:hypothetical protein
MPSRNNTKRQVLESISGNGSMNDSPAAQEKHPAEAEAGRPDSGASAHAPSFTRDVAANAPYCEGERASLGQRVSALARGFRRLLGSGYAARKVGRAAVRLPGERGRRNVDDDAGLITQINERDREHMQQFSPELKVQVMQKIATLKPEENESYQGDNRFEKVMMIIHREGYGLIDLQPYESALTSVWYRKNGRMSKNAEVMMLMWEETAQGDNTTVMRWKI